MFNRQDYMDKEVYMSYYDIELSKDCIHCGQCTKNCTFLTKYNMDLKSFEEHSELGYSCFLCNKCKIVCPVDIDGAAIGIKHRRKEVADNGGKLAKKGYSGIVWEKYNYKFRNYRNSKGVKSAIFTGCNFLSYTPNTANTLIDVMKKFDVGVIYDCCGKPISELGLRGKEEEIINNIQKKLDDMGIEELIMVCPNCYYYLEGRLDIRMVDIYTKLKELGIGYNFDEEEINMFRPCPDRESNYLEEKVAKFMPNTKINNLNEQCCGAGGCAGVREPGLSSGFKEDIKAQAKGEKVYTYCATCTGMMKPRDIDISHVLTKILGVEEDKVGNSLVNRLKYKFK